LFAVQVYGPKGWKYGPPLYGLDVVTGIVGGHFTGSKELADEEMDRLITKGYLAPENVRIVKFSPGRSPSDPP
jgi:hypothetical protein